MRETEEKQNKSKKHITDQIMLQIGSNVLIVLLLIAVVSILMVNTVLMIAKQRL